MSPLRIEHMYNVGDFIHYTVLVKILPSCCLYNIDGSRGSMECYYEGHQETGRLCFVDLLLGRPC